MFPTDWIVSKYKLNITTVLQLKHLENIVFYSVSKPKGVITLEVNYTYFHPDEINPWALETISEVP